MNTTIPFTYRAQRPDGRGPYRPEITPKWFDYEAGDDEHGGPPFWSDGDGTVMARISIQLVNHGGLCASAFSSIKQAKKWFNRNEREKLLGLSFKLVRIKTAKILFRSESQIVIWVRGDLLGQTHYVDWVV